MLVTRPTHTTTPRRSPMGAIMGSQMFAAQLPRIATNAIAFDMATGAALWRWECGGGLYGFGSAGDYSAAWRQTFTYDHEDPDIHVPENLKRATTTANMFIFDSRGVMTTGLLRDGYDGDISNNDTGVGIFDDQLYFWRGSNSTPNTFELQWCDMDGENPGSMDVTYTAGKFGPAQIIQNPDGGFSFAARDKIVLAATGYSIAEYYSPSFTLSAVRNADRVFILGSQSSEAYISDGAVGYQAIGAPISSLLSGLWNYKIRLASNGLYCYNGNIYDVEDLTSVVGTFTIDDRDCFEVDSDGNYYRYTGSTTGSLRKYNSSNVQQWATDAIRIDPAECFLAINGDTIILAGGSS